MSSEFVLLLRCRVWCSGTLVGQNDGLVTSVVHGGWCVNSESSVVATL